MTTKNPAPLLGTNTSSASVILKTVAQKCMPACFIINYLSFISLFWYKKSSKHAQQQGRQKYFSFMLLLVSLSLPATANCNELDWSVGGYGGMYFDTEPGSFADSKTNYLNQYLVAITASKSIWRADKLPLSLEIDGMLGYQFGLTSLYELAVAPVLRWSSFPWKDTLQTDFRFAPVGISYTPVISPLERGPDGRGSPTLNYFIAELGFSLPQEKSKMVFFRIHHRSAFNDVLNDYGANGEDFFTVGYRQYY